MNGQKEKGAPSNNWVLVCFALKAEAGAFEKKAKARPGVSILVTGIGQQNAEKAVRGFLAARIPARVLSCGFAGALISGLEVGQVVFETDDVRLREELAATGAKAVKFFCADRIATTAREKQALRKGTNADAVEMESAAIGRICGELQLPFATVRVISDAADDDLPLDFNALSKPDRSLDYGRLALAVAKSPGKIGALMRLQKQARLAAQKIAEVLARVILP